VKPVLLARRRGASSARQHGVTLIIALVMLVVIGLASAAVMRSSLTSDVVANNTRLHTLAQQAAQLALRFCETQVERESKDWIGGFSIHDASPGDPYWQSFASWQGGGAVQAVDVPDAVLASADSSFKPSTAPQCLAEWSDAVPGTRTIIVTARGFSPDFDQTDTGRQTAGSVVWLQSTLRVK
jgi:type IV pilus assembly protein PilX